MVSVKAKGESTEQDEIDPKHEKFLLDSVMWRDVALIDRGPNSVEHVEVRSMTGPIQFERPKVYAIHLNESKTPDYVVKIYSEKNKKLFEREDYAYSYFNKLGIPTPTRFPHEKAKLQRAVILKNIPGPAHFSSKNVSLDMEITFLNDKIDYLNEQITQGFKDSDEMKEKKEDIKRLKDYVIKEALRTIAELNVKADFSVFEKRANKLIKVPFSYEKFYGGKIAFKKSFNPARNKMQNKILEAVLEMKGRNLVLNGTDLIEVQKMIESKRRQLLPPDQLEKIVEFSEFLMTPVMDYLVKKVPGRVVNGGDNYPHNFIRDDFRDPKTNKWGERAYIFDFDKVEYVEVERAPTPFTCSPISGLSYGEISNYLNVYFTYFKELEKEFRQRSNQTRDEFLRDAVLFGIFESAFHGPSIGVKHELYSKDNYDDLIKRTRHVDSLHFGYSRADKDYELSKLKFEYSCYDNHNMIPRYQKTANSLITIVTDNKLQGTKFSSEHRKCADNLRKFLQKKEFIIEENNNTKEKIRFFQE